MIVLAVDTSGPVCGVAIAQDDRVLYEASAVNRHTHSASLLPMIDEAFRRTGLAVGDSDLFAAVVGPGSFTGVRIGVSTVKGLAHGACKPCAGVNALQALAAGIGETSALLCPIQDARAGQVYGAAFLGGMPPVRVLPDTAAKLEPYLESVQSAADSGQKLLFVGDGVQTYRGAIAAILKDRAAFPPAHLSFLRPAAVALLARFTPAMDYLALLPQYLRAPQAERARKGTV